jgi:hypothetical protein
LSHSKRLACIISPKQYLATFRNMDSCRVSQVIYAPSEEAPRHAKSIFLAGTTSKVDTADWRETLSASLSRHPVTIYNPYRADWDSTWREDANFTPYREQVRWELDKQAKADLVVVYFHPATQAPVSLLEFGLSAKVPGRVIAVCPEGFWKRGNVQVVSEVYGVQLLDDVEKLEGAIFSKFSFR